MDSDEDNVTLSELKKSINNASTDEDEDNIPLNKLAYQIRQTDHQETYNSDQNNNRNNCDNTEAIDHDYTNSQINNSNPNNVVESYDDANMNEGLYINGIPDDFETFDYMLPLFEDGQSGEIILSPTFLSDDTDIGQELEIYIQDNGNESAGDSTDDFDETLQTDETTCSEEDTQDCVGSHLSRRRKRHPDEWKQSTRKRKRNHGEEYISVKGKKVPRRKPTRPSCKCKYACCENISEDDQSTIFHQYWRREYADQRHFLMTHVIKEEKKRKTTKGESRRKNTIQYFLSIPKKENSKTRVCKRFFLATLNIGERTVIYTINKDATKTKDQRGRRKGWSKIPEREREFIRTHIESFPVMESHYCRKKTQRKYLERDLSIQKMFELYKERCTESGRDPQKFWLYDHIFGTEYNLGFHKPKKDVCSFCDSYFKMSEHDKLLQNNNYDAHIRRKEMARNQKSNDKEQASINENIVAVNFDLQKVLNTPKLFVSDAYYSRKLATYNLSIYNMSSKGVICNVWWETQGKRGSCEIASCLYYFNQKIGNKMELIYFSDTCTGQQRNLYFCMMCLYSVVNFPIQVITHNYFERGHSQMEGDSVHSTIETSTKKLEIYSPSDWISAIKNAKKSIPKYEVKEITTEMIIDFKEFSDKTVTNRKKIDDSGETLMWTKVHSFQYRKEAPNKIFFKYDYDEPYRSLTITRGRRQNAPNIKDYSLKKLYTQQIPITDAKYTDLMSLCKKGFIPEVHHRFYQQLPHSSQTGLESTVSDESENEHDS